MSKRKHGNFNIPDDPSDNPSVLAIVLLFLIPSLVTQCIAGYLVFKKIKNLTQRKRLQLFRRYASAIGTDTTISLRALAARMDVPLANLVDDIQAMIDEGYITGDAYIDHSHMALHLSRVADPSARNDEPVTSHMKQSARGRAYSDAASYGGEPDPSRRAVRDADPAAPASRLAQDTPVSGNDDFESKLRQIRELNDSIRDPAVSERIDRIGELTAGIFRVVRENPEKADEVRKFMNYYLLTTLKLLKSYSLMERQSYQGETIQASRKKIEEVLNTLVRAFEQQQDRLFRADALDVEADISVLETMMASDGLVRPEGELRMSGSGKQS